jgi:DNA-binding NarL/FixJ family response regulator
MSTDGRPGNVTQTNITGDHRILIVARSGSLSDGLAALLSALPQVSQVLQARDLDTAVRLTVANQPQLIIVDCDHSGDGLGRLLNTLRRQAPAVRYLALAGNVEQKKSIEKLHADAVLLKGAPATAIITMVESLLEWNQGEK